MVLVCQKILPLFLKYIYGIEFTLLCVLFFVLFSVLEVSTLCVEKIRTLNDEIYFSSFEILEVFCDFQQCITNCCLYQ
jgi:hypothetical protein